MFCQSLSYVSFLYGPCNSDTSLRKSKQLVISVNVFNASLALVSLSGPYTALSCVCFETLPVHTADSAEANPYATPSHADNSALLKCAQKQLMAKEKNILTFCYSRLKNLYIKSLWEKSNDFSWTACHKRIKFATRTPSSTG